MEEVCGGEAVGGCWWGVVGGGLLVDSAAWDKA